VNPTSPPTSDSAAANNSGATPSPPADVAHPRAVRSFVRRAGRTTAGQARALQDLGPRFMLPYVPSLEALAQQYPQLAPPAGASGPVASHPPLVFEIGFGMGEASAQIAALLPATEFLCCEVHEPGVGALLKRIGDMGLRNIHIVAHDAVEVIDHMLPVWDAGAPLRGLDGVHIFFPDPWHKSRHNKRRLVQAPLVQRLAARLKPGGYIHCATDWQPYAEQMLDVLGHEPALENRCARSHPELGGYAPRPHYRPLTKFENRGLRLGHGVWDLVFHRV
jgi:tRNA (guanine-N7-)-methyltransferase